MAEYGISKANGEIQAAFKGRAHAVNFSRGEIILRPADEKRALYLIIKGEVRLFRPLPNGRRLILAILGPGAIFGEGALMGQEPESWAEAASDCTLWAMDGKRAEELSQANSSLAMALLQQVGRRLQAAEQRLEEMAYASMEARLASVLLDLAEGGAILEGFSHEDLAEMVGTYRETITQTLNQFQCRGWVKLGRKRIELRDREALREVAGRW